VEKVLYVLPASDVPSDELGAALRGPLADELLDRGAHGLQINVADAAVAPAAGLRMAGSGSPAVAVLGVWVDSAIDHLRTPYDAAVEEVAPGASAYLVTESVPLRDLTAASPGGRTEGMAQVAFLRRRADLDHARYLDTWLRLHTPLAIDTQATFGYVQNVVVRALTADAHPWDGIVEELFPAEAMTDAHVFFDAVGDDERLAANQAAMIDSVSRFLDLAALDVVPTSRYVVVPVPARG
jgi:hypothetical protein